MFVMLNVVKHYKECCKNCAFYKHGFTFTSSNNSLDIQPWITIT